MPRKSRGTRLAVTFTALAAVVAAPVAAIAPATAAPAPDQLVLTRVGVEGTDYADAPTTVALVTRGTDGTATAPDVTLPSSGENPFTLSGSSNAQGALSLSTDGRYLSLAGFKLAAGTGEDDPKDLTADEAPRSIARIAADGTADTSTVLTGVFSGENMRGAASADGSTFYSAGNGKDNASPSGIVLSALGTTAAPGAITTPDPAGGKTIANYRAVSIVDGALYASGDKPEGHVSRVGTDLPAAGEATLDTLFNLPGTPDELHAARHGRGRGPGRRVRDRRGGRDLQVRPRRRHLAGRGRHRGHLPGDHRPGDRRRRRALRREGRRRGERRPAHRRLGSPHRRARHDDHRPGHRPRRDRLPRHLVRAGRLGPVGPVQPGHRPGRRRDRRLPPGWRERGPDRHLRPGHARLRRRHGSLVARRRRSPHGR